MKAITFFLLLASLPLSVFAQTIIGRITKTDGTALPYANILIKEANKPESISEFAIGRNGSYAITLQKNYERILIEVKANNYFLETSILENPQKGQSYTVDFVLEDNKEINLQEVVVEAKKNPIEIKEDTVNYDVKAYSDGSERKIQDILKKLPGVEVDDKTGEIKYKGKSVETVLLDGDNLFGYNYTLGTRNINVDMVEQVQAIENYSENPLLKGIETGDKVALNLKLKKGRFDFSGETNATAGFTDKGKALANLYADVLGITKNFKSFGTFSFNNIGVNYSPFDYFGSQPNIEQIKEQNYFAKKVIPETAFFDAFELANSINEQFFGNYNSIFKLGKRLSVKSNLYYVKDELFSTQLFETRNTIGSQDFTTSDERTIFKRPTQYRADLDLKYNTSKSSLLEYNLRIRQENINTPINLLVNETNTYQSELKSEDFYFKQSLLFTQKISPKKVLQFSMFQSSNNIPQTLQISPPVFNLPNTGEDIQKSNFGKNFLEAKAILLGSSKNIKYSFTVGADMQEFPYQSDLYNFDAATNTRIPLSQNKVDYSQASLYTLGSFDLFLGRWRFSPAYSFSLLEQRIQNKADNNLTQINNLIFEPSLTIYYKLGETSKLFGKAGYNQNPITGDFIFGNQVLTNNRTTVNNQVSLDLQKIISYGLFYIKNDLSNQFSLSLGIDYQQKTGNYFSNFSVQPFTTQIIYFFAPLSNEQLNLNFMVEKYILFMESLVRLKSGYSIAGYKNIVNNSTLRDNQNILSNTELSIRTALDIPINFEIISSYNLIRSQNTGGTKFINSSFNNTLKIKFSPAEKWFVGFSSALYIPNLDKTAENFLFLDFNVRFRPGNERFEWNFFANNLLNQDNFRQVQTTDYSRNLFQTNLFPRYFLLNLTYTF